MDIKREFTSKMWINFNKLIFIDWEFTNKLVSVLSVCRLWIAKLYQSLVAEKKSPFSPVRFHFG